MTSNLESLFTLPARILTSGWSVMTSALRTVQPGPGGSTAGPACPLPGGSLIESGLQSMNTALKTMQSAVGTLTGQKQPELPVTPPYDGPADIDSAVSDFANRLARIAYTTSWDPSELRTALQDVVSAVRHSFGYVDLRDPRSATLPIQLALSIGTLLTQSGLRGLATYEAIGPQNY